MDASDSSKLLTELISATSSLEIQKILRALGDRSDLEIDEIFGELKLFWHPYGDNTSNLSTIGLATKPGRSLTERLTNGEDAVLEGRALTAATPPKSPRLAAKQWFDRPISGPDSGLFQWEISGRGYDRLLNIVLTSSGSETAPTVDVVDQGIGIKPSDFPVTILSLQAGNKISKFYLVGAFGQGGSSTLAFCDYVVIVSRHKQDSRVGFTIIKVMAMNENYKEDSYVYLASRDENGNVAVPSAEIAEGALALYKPKQGLSLPTVQHGTLVRHVAYKLGDIAGALGPAPGNLYHYLHCSLFDPLFPFRIVDLRFSGKERDELVTGSRNRLMRLAHKAKGSETEEAGSEIRHYRPMEYVVPYGTNETSIGIEYWVVFNHRRRKDGSITLRPQSNELYINTGHPIVGTLNGQNQGELTAKILRDVGLSMVAKHIAIHIDATNVNRTVRRELFSTSREGFKEGDILRGIVRVLEKMLSEDEELQKIERELTEKLARQEDKSTDDEVKKQVTRLLLDAGLQLQEEGPSITPGEGEMQSVRKERRGRHRVADPLPTLPFPDVTRFEIVAPQDKLEVNINDSEVVLVETDADSEFDNRGLVAIRSEPGLLEVAAKAPLRGGRLRWRMRPKESATPGATGRIVAALTKPDGSQIRDERDYVILPPQEEKVKVKKGLVPPFEILPIHPENEPETWENLWPNYGDDVTSDKQASVAYRVLHAQNKVIVYYSIIFRPYLEQIERLKQGSQALVEIFDRNYKIWIGYHAILQDRAQTNESQEIPEDIIDSIKEQERIRVARMQVKQALRTAELTQDLLRYKSSQ
jgi:hypothetical protein